MNYPTHTASRLQKDRQNARAFTLLELLVVVAVISLLAGILIPAMGLLRRQGNNAAARGQLHSISMGLEQYHADFSIYPPSNVVDWATGKTFTYDGNPSPFINRGDAMLAEAMMGYLPYDVDGAGPKNSNGSVSPSPADPGLGFRTRQQPSGKNQNGMGGKVYGPYVAIDKGFSFPTATGIGTFIDPWGNPVLYYCATGSTPLAAVQSGAPYDIFTSRNQQFGTSSGPPGLFLNDDCLSTIIPSKTNPNASDSTAIPSLPSDQTSRAQFFTLLNAPLPPVGDVAPIVHPGDHILGADSYLLISAGNDGIYFRSDNIVMSKQ